MLNSSKPEATKKATADPNKTREQCLWPETKHPLRRGSREQERERKIKGASENRGRKIFYHSLFNIVSYSLFRVIEIKGGKHYSSSRLK